MTVDCDSVETREVFKILIYFKLIGGRTHVFLVFYFILYSIYYYNLSRSLYQRNKLPLESAQLDISKKSCSK